MLTLGEMMLAIEDIVGTWKLTCCETRYCDGRTGVHPVGENATGYILYNPDGYVSLELVAQKRLSFTQQDPFAETEEGYAELMRSHLSYVGTFEIRGDYLIHHVEISSYPDFIGHKIERFTRLEDDKLYQTTEPLFMHGESHVVHLELQRVTSAVAV
ncbi:MAG: lipocalin-like domain-containing protein [Chlamydiia bacterium]|nr:lipocalin-like domain-containing protein [Chlamydiia bacterium]MCP5509519.1 lipocalin-like domain-containing protein [Chlamydiales bacterium]HPE84865.1 lipocalin-like domain-containing protein [Chlamydiales bacterium]